MTKTNLVAIAKMLWKGALWVLRYAAVLMLFFLGAGGLGFFYGTYLGVEYDSRHYFHVGKDWLDRAIRHPAGEPNSFEAKVISDITPFIDLSHDSVKRDWKNKKLSKTEVLERQYFKTEDLPHGTMYIPWLWTPSDPDTPLAVMNDHLAEIVVVLVGHQGVEPKVGLIPLDEYEEFLRRTGVRKAGK